MRWHEPTIAYVARRTAEWLSTRDHPLPQALPRLRGPRAAARPDDNGNDASGRNNINLRSIRLNAVAESFFATLKVELVDRRQFRSHPSAHRDSCLDRRVPRSSRSR